MQVALIAPIPNLELTRLGDIHMILAHLVGISQYQQFYKSENKYKILDNGAFEEIACSIEALVEAAKLVKADEIVLPDVIYNRIITIKRARASIAWLKERQLLGKYKLLAVPQGTSAPDWWLCFNELNEMEHIDVIGFSKLSCPKCFGMSVADSRIQIVTAMEDNGWWNKDKEYHLLGSSYDAIRETQIMKQYEQIRSVDTSAPVQYGRAGFSLLEGIERQLLDSRDLTQPIANLRSNKIGQNIGHLLDAANR